MRAGSALPSTVLIPQTTIRSTARGLLVALCKSSSRSATGRTMFLGRRTDLLRDHRPVSSNPGSLRAKPPFCLAHARVNTHVTLALILRKTTSGKSAKPGLENHLACRCSVAEINLEKSPPAAPQMLAEQARRSYAVSFRDGELAAKEAGQPTARLPGQTPSLTWSAALWHLFALQLRPCRGIAGNALRTSTQRLQALLN